MSTITEIRKIQSEKYKNYVETVSTAKAILDAKITLLQTKLDDSINSIGKADDIIRVNLCTADIKLRILQNKDIIVSNNLTDNILGKIDNTIVMISCNEKLKFNVTAGFAKTAAKKIVQDLKEIYLALGIEPSFDTVLMDVSNDEEIARKLAESLESLE